MRLLLFFLFALATEAANFVPNSSFQLGGGPGRGWITIGDATVGNYLPISGFLTNGSSYDGDTSYRISGALSSGNLTSRAFFLTNGTYTLSFCMRCESGAQGPMKFGVIRGTEIYTTEPVGSSTISGNWTRYSTTYTVTTGQPHHVRFYTTTPYVYQVDAIQLEPGSTANTYETQRPVEIGLAISNINSVWFAGDTPKFCINAYNTGAGIDPPIRYDVYDVFNSNCLSGTIVPHIGPASSYSTTVNLPARYGWYRVTAYITNSNDAGDEITTAYYPFSSNRVADASGWLGGHPHATPFHAGREMLVRRKFGRTLSPSYPGTRWQLVEPTRTNFVFTDSVFSGLAAEGVKIIAPLTAADGTWNNWATNTDGTADLNAWSNYVHKVVNRYKSYDPYWEVWNEPFQSGPTTPINIRSVAGYVQVLERGIWAITNADPNAKIIAMGGANDTADWSWQVWTNLSAGAQANIDVISTHIYVAEASGDPNIWDYNNAFFYPTNWMQTFLSTGLPIWNTECGVYGVGSFKTWNGLFTFYVTSGFSPESTRSEHHNRQLVATQRITTEALRNIGSGFGKLIYYDSRLHNDNNYVGAQPYVADYLNVDRPELVALSVASHMVHKGFGRAVKSADEIKLYVFSNLVNQTVVAAWNDSKDNRTITITNAQVAQFDVMGNLMQTGSLTAVIGRIPCYFVSGSLSQVSMSNTIKFCSQVAAADTRAPFVSIDICPSGQIASPTNLLVKWTPLDDVATAWTSADTATNVMTRYRLNAGASVGSWSDYTQSNHMWAWVPSNGTYWVDVQARDKTGNESAVVSGPSFFLGDPPAMEPGMGGQLAQRSGRTRFPVGLAP